MTFDIINLINWIIKCSKKSYSTVKGIFNSVKIYFLLSETQKIEISNRQYLHTIKGTLNNLKHCIVSSSFNLNNLKYSCKYLNLSH